MYTFQFSIDRRAGLRLLGVLAAFLLVASLTGQWIKFTYGHDIIYGLVPLFNVDAEANIPTFFSVCLGFINAALLCIIALAAGRRNRRESIYWACLSAGFLCLAYDEGFQVHEMLVAPMRRILGGTDLGYLYFGWVVPGIAGVAILSLLFLHFFLHLPPDTRRRMLIAAGLYFGGCLGMEMVDGKYFATHGDSFIYSLLATLEEGLEMAGLIANISALLQHIAEYGETIVFHMVPGEERIAAAAEQPILEAGAADLSEAPAVRHAA